MTLRFSPHERIEEVPLFARDFIVEAHVEWDGSTASDAYVHHESARCTPHGDITFEKAERGVVQTRQSLMVQHAFLRTTTPWELAPGAHRLKVPRAKQHTMEFRVFYCPADDTQRAALFDSDDPVPDPVGINTFVGEHAFQSMDVVTDDMTTKGLLVAHYCHHADNYTFASDPTHILPSARGASVTDHRRCYTMYSTLEDGQKALAAGSSIQELISTGVPVLSLRARRGAGDMDHSEGQAAGRDVFTSSPVHFHIVDMRVSFPKCAVTKLRHKISLAARDSHVCPIVTSAHALEDIVARAAQARGV